jgi:DNA-binding transcriptional regulator of glucitol operon
VIALIVLTFAVALVIGAWQWSNARRSKERRDDDGS